MPVRLHEIPGFQSTRINAAPMDADAAAAPAAALGGIGQAFAGISAPFAKIATNIQEAANAEQLSKIRTGMDEARAKFLLDLEKDPDPGSRLAKTQGFLQKQKQVIDTPGLPRASRDKLVPYVDEWASGTNISVAKSAAELQVRRADTATHQELAAARGAKDLRRAHTVIDTRVSAGLTTPEQAIAEKEHARKTFENDAFNDRIAAAPAVYLADPIKSGDAILDERRTEFARAHLLTRTIEGGGEVLDQIYSENPISPSEVEMLSDAHGLRDEAKAELRAISESRATAAKRTVMDAEGNVPDLVGEATMLMSGYSSKGDRFDSDDIRINSLIRALPVDSPVRKELERELAAVRDGIPREYESREAAAFGTLNRGFRSELAKLEPSPQAPRGGDDRDATMNARADGNAGAEAAYHDPEAEDAVISSRLKLQKRYGRIKAELAIWLKLTPDAAEERINGKIQELYTREVRDAQLEGPEHAPLFSPRDVMGRDIHEMISNIDPKHDVDGLSAHRARVAALAAEHDIPLRPHQLDALASFDQSTGQTERLLAYGTRDDMEIADAMLRYRNEDGRRSTDLMRRRQVERAVFLHGYGVS